MENNTSRIIWTIVGLIAIVLVLFGVTHFYRSRNIASENNPAASIAPEDASIQTVDVKHQYKNGVHTYAGEIDVPTACDLLEVSVTKSADNKANLGFITSNTSEQCAEVITTRRFKATVTAPPEIAVTGTMNGKELKLNFFEVPGGEDLDNFEIDIKG